MAATAISAASPSSATSFLMIPPIRRWCLRYPGYPARTLHTARHPADKWSMDDAGTWLCPTQLHRERLLDMERMLARPRAVMYGSLALAFIVGIPWIGWWTLIPLAGAILSYAAFK